jgi:hypothetical protein
LMCWWLMKASPGSIYSSTSIESEMEMIYTFGPAG